MKLIKIIKRGINYLGNNDIDLRIRLLFFLEYAALFACIIGTIAMVAFATSIKILIPNFVLIAFCLVGIYLSHVKKKYDAASFCIIGGCSYIALPYMYFTAGGFKSGMPVWFVFAVVFTCLMMRGRLRRVMPVLCVAISIDCLLISHYYPDTVIPLASQDAEFWDLLQSYIIVSVVICISLMIYIASYDRQRKSLEQKSIELKRAMYTDSLTGIANRHAYYDDTNEFSDKFKENLVLVAMDINGLKTVNDTEGHAAGDELIKAATGIMVDAYAGYGKIYRTGGDEFVAILDYENCDAEKLKDIIDTTIKNQNEKNGTSISIATGIAVWNDNRDKNYFELEKLADSVMYKNKSEFYKNAGRDRRKR